MYWILKAKIHYSIPANNSFQLFRQRNLIHHTDHRLLILPYLDATDQTKAVCKEAQVCQATVTFV